MREVTPLFPSPHRLISVTGATRDVAHNVDKHRHLKLGPLTRHAGPRSRRLSLFLRQYVDHVHKIWDILTLTMTLSHPLISTPPPSVDVV